jgi:hypothetical protein
LPVTKHLFVNSLKFALGIGLFNWGIWTKWDPSFSEFLERIEWAPVALSAVFYLCGLVSTFIRWHLLVRAQDLPFRLANAVRLGLLGFSLNVFLHCGDAVRAFLIALEQRRRTVAVATVLLDRAFGLWGLIWLVTLVGLGFNFMGNPLLLENAILRRFIYATAGVTAGSLGIWFVLGAMPQARADRFASRLGRVPKIGHSLAEFWRAFWLYRCKGGSITLAVLLGVFNHTCSVFAIYFAAQAFQPAGSTAEIPSLGEHFLLVPLARCFVILPHPSGVDPVNWAMSWFYGLLGFPAAEAVIGLLAMRLVISLLAFVGYLVAVFKVHVYLRDKPSLGATEQQIPGIFIA